MALAAPRPDAAQKLEQCKRQDLLSLFVSEWDWYAMAGKRVSFTFRYLNQHWVEKELEKKTKDVYFIYDVCAMGADRRSSRHPQLVLVIWREIVFNKLKHLVRRCFCRLCFDGPQIVPQLLDLIEKERNGEIINTSPLASCVDCIVLMGVESDKHFVHLHVYKEDFEKPFIEVGRHAAASLLIAATAHQAVLRY